LKTIFIYILFASCGIVQCLELKFTDPLNNKRMENQAVFEQNRVSEVECVINCGAKENCDSVNHHEGNQICVLNSHPSGDFDSETSLIEANGWKFFKKSKVS